MSNLVKLQIYEHTADEVVIDSFEAKTWEDFVIIEVDYMDFDTVEHLRTAVQEYCDQHPEKQILMVPKSMNLTFYGIEKDDEEGTVDADPGPVSEG